MPRRLTPRQKAARLNRAKRGGITPEGREALRLAALARRPWEHSTGPRTAAGKQASRENALQHGGRAFVTLPIEVQTAISTIQAAERGQGPIPELGEVYLAVRMLTGGGWPLVLRGSSLLLRYQRLVLRLVG